MEKVHDTAVLPPPGGKTRLRVGMRARAMALVVVAFLPFAVFVVYLAEQSRQRAADGMRTQAQLLAHRIADEHARLIDGTRRMMEGLALSMQPALPAVLTHSCEQFVERLVRQEPRYLSAAIADRGGQLVCHSSGLLRATSIADRAHFQRAIDERAFAFDGPIVSRIMGRPTMVAAQPLVSVGGELLGVMTLTVDLEWMASQLAAVPAPDHTVITLVDRKGTVIARHPHREEFSGRAISDLDAFLRFAADAKSSDHVIAYGLDGIERKFAYAPIEADGANLFIRVGLSRSEVDKAVRQTILSGAGAIAAVLLLTLAIAWAAATGLVVRPLRQLAAVADRLRRGDLTARADITDAPDEIARLGASLDGLASATQRSRRALTALSAGNRTLLREKSEPELLQAMCRVAVEQAGYRLAMVNFAQDDDEKSVRTVAKAGHDEGFVDALKLTWADSERGRATVGSTIRSGKTSVIRCLATEPRYALWRESAIAHRFGSVASFPLKVDGRVIGTFTLVAEEESAFDDEELALLEEMADDLAFGIEVVRSNARRVVAEDQLRRSLTHDSLVDLPNRQSFIGMVDELIRDQGAGKSGVAVVAIHFGGLQDIFDSFGYGPYRAVLKELASRLSTVPAFRDASARLPMEDFGLLVPTKDRNILGVIAERILASLKSPVPVGEVALDVRAALGVSFYPEHGEDGESLIRRASLGARDAFKKDIAFQVYSGTSEREQPDRLALAADLRKAIEEDKVQLHYQPKVRIADGARVGYEALARWFHPARGAVSPGAFIPVAEQMGMIGPMTNNVIRLAVRQLHEWQNHAARMPVAVNLSARNLYDPLLVTSVQRWLKSYNVPGELLDFEITEGALIEQPDAARHTLNQLRALGARIYIDDFGTGYSSLSYLASLPVNSLKIDRSFINQMARSAEAHAVVASVISMAHNLRLGVVAEGVETAEQLETLKALGCDEAQGYFFGKPVPADQLQG